MIREITLSEYARIKDSTINAVAQYALGKGIVIPEDPDFLLDDSVLKLIDPVFHYKLKFEQTNDLKTSCFRDVSVGSLKAFYEKHLNEKFIGTIEKVMHHGAYISFEGVSGFLSAKDVTWKYMDDIHNYLHEGKTIEIVILDYDDQRTKLLVGRKQLQDDPLLQIVDSLSIGDVIVGVLRKITKKNRAYIEVENGAIAESDIPDGFTYPEGQSITGRVQRIDANQHLLEVEIISELSEKPKASDIPSKKKKDLERNVAVVQFYDNKVNFFGRVLTNSLGIGNNDSTGNLLSYNLNRRNWLPALTPDDGDWIVMIPSFYKGRREATKGEYLTYDKKGLLLAFPYRGKYSRIVGIDSKGASHDHNVICHVIDRVLRKADGKSVIVESLAEYLSSFIPDEMSHVVEEFLQDKELTKRFISLLPELRTFHNGSDRCDGVLKILVQSVEDAVFSTKDISVFDILPDDFDYDAYSSKTVAVLEESAKEQTALVKKWFDKHPAFLNSLLAHTLSMSMDLLYAVFLVSQDFSLFDNTGKKWNEIYDWLKNRSETTALSFLLSFFSSRDRTFIEQSQVIDLLPYDDKKVFVSKLLDDPSQHIDVLTFFAGEFVQRDFGIIYDYVSSGIVITHVYGKIGLHLETLINENEPEVRQFFNLCADHNISPTDILADLDGLSDEMAIEMFAQTSDPDYLNLIEEFDDVPNWLNQQDAEFIGLFLQSCQTALKDEDDKKTIADTLMSIDKEKFRDAITSMSEDDQYKILQLCPDDYSRDIVGRFFASTHLFDLYIGEQWKKLKASVPYVSFDLESDGDTVYEFAFRMGENTKVYQGEEQLSTLSRALKKSEIIVGHRIKEWDLGTVLKKKGVESDAFVWDTLEIEILLNPCRYSYALHTGHKAQEDTELVDRLFWNQLFRLSQNEGLCQELANWLPKQINEILEVLRQPIYSDFFSRDSGEAGFYQVLVDIEEEVALLLDTINESEERALIIAPKRLWSRIAEHVNLRFAQADIEYLTISQDRLNEKPLEDAFQNAILQRFISLSKTPVLANLAQYLRMNYMPDTLLADYLVESQGKVDCVDMDYVFRDTLLGGYDHIYFIGCEIENRVNQYSLPTQFSPSDFWSSNSSIPMRLGASSYLAITQDERQLSIFNDVPSDAANVWIERTLQGKYVISYNYDYYSIIKSITEKTSEHVRIDTIPWMTNNEAESNITLVFSKKGRGFDAISKRVSATSRYRASYWTYQFALLHRIREAKSNYYPIILFLDDSLEIGKVEEYARTLGYYVPLEGTLIRRLELIDHHPDGMLVTSKEQFFEIADWRKDRPYLYVWDHLAVEKHMMMWHGFADEQNKSFLYDGIEEKVVGGDAGSIMDTYQSALLSIWPVYEYYFRFIKANSAESSMYVLDSFLEEYHSLSSVWGVSAYGITELWQNEEDFNRALNKAKGVFVDEVSLYNNNADVDTAMNVILETLIRTDRVPNPVWSDVQKEILPQILSRRENYLVSLPTGGGKSVLFQGPALYNSAYTNKLSIVVTPLKALMQDQVKELGEKGFISNVDYLNGDRSYQEVRSIYRKINGGEIAILYVTPERFRSRAFLDALSTRMANDHGLEYMVFDEAHCISQWGMEFRPEYLNVIKKCKEIKDTYGDDMCIAMFSATVTDMIYEQINEVVPVKRLGQENDQKIYSPIRSHIGMEFKEVLHDIPHRLDEIVAYIKSHSVDPQLSRMLVFCRSRNQCEEMALLLADRLQREGVLNKSSANLAVGYFHAGMDGEDREDTYNRFKDENDPLYILCATKAFGMGMDIPNIHYIVHLMPPNVMEDYLQEVGRAGRNEAMYINAGFNVDNPIPTVCFCSKDDIRKAREQLLQNMLSWKNLEEIRIAINSYISHIQSIEKTKEYPIVVPSTLWANGQFDFDFTDFRIGQYWLERMGRIKMGYLSPAHINITLLDEEGSESLEDKLKRLSSIYKGKSGMDVLSELRIIQRVQQSSTIQVSLQELASSLSMTSTKLLDCMIWCEKHSIIRIEQESRCNIAFTRLSEVNYMLSRNSVEVAFHVILNATRSLLENCRLKVERSYSLSDIQRFIKEADTLENLVKEVTTEENGTQKYMIWYNENDKQKNKGLSIAKSYHDDLYKKRFRQVISLLELIPDVKVQSYLDTKRKCVLQSVIVEKDTWKDFLDDFRDDCIRLLTYVNQHKQTTLRWSDAIVELKLEEKGFSYFDNLMSYLNGMAYLATDPLLPTGIEIYTTDHSGDVIFENINNESSDFENKVAFDESMEIRNLRLCVMDVLTTRIHNKHDFQDLIGSYFTSKNSEDFRTLLSKYYDDSDPIWDALRATAIKSAEEQLKDNSEQWAIYQENSNVNVNVEAGPGSGKTHVLTLKCAKLIFHQHVNPKSILVLAYNRAVVVELKSRLAKLFASLGLSRSASQLHVYTFHSLAKRVCGDALLEGREMSEWEGLLLNTITHNPNEVRAVMPDLQYVFIDEFQDITQTRLNAMFGLKAIYNPLTFFTIGDKDQSIYGFEKEESMDPNYYYNQLYEKLNPKKMMMNTNYRSYPKILNAASRYLPPTSHAPVPCRKNIANEPKADYVYIYDKRDWAQDFGGYVQWMKAQGVSDLAVFFRTNNEVYHGYSLIKALNLQGIRIRIQGASACELYRVREIYAVLKLLDDSCNQKLILEGDKTESDLKKTISSWIQKFPNWDSFYMDFAFVLILDYLDFAASDEDSHTYGEMADSIRETLKEDNPQLYKLYDDKRFADRRILVDYQMNVVLTTMHKVKGLEFDAVMITSSVASLPFNPTEDVDMSHPLSPLDKEQIEEERRLLYVAYTRARKFLFVYKGNRELAVENMCRFASLEDQWGIREQKVGLDNYNIGYNAGFNFKNNNSIVYNVRKNDPLTVKRYRGVTKGGQSFSTFNIVHNGKTVGQLSRKSNIVRHMEAEGIDILNGFFVSEVFYWSYEDTLAADKRAEAETGKNPNYAAGWCPEARDLGYIFIVNIAGYGN